LFGNITIGSKGGGKKGLFKKISLNHRSNFSILISIFYDPKRTAFISLCYNFLTSKFNNYLTTLNTFPGSVIFSYFTFPELKLGAFVSLKYVPAGSLIHSIFFSSKSKYIKSAGTFGILIQKGFKFSKIKLPSGEIKIFLTSSFCILGSLSNLLHRNIIIGKAGRSRLLNKRPKVRGVAMNPVDHPHGGQTSGGIPSVTPWGLPTKGKPTRKKKKCQEHDGKDLFLIKIFY